MRFPKTIRRRSQFLTAITVAAIFGISRFTLPEVWIAIKSVWSAVWADKKGNVPRGTWVHRMKCCIRCPIYDLKRKTCGSPFSTHPDLGCYCFEPIASRQESKVCWLDENGDGSTPYGWKEVEAKTN
jgi:hypothetical protein